MKRNVNGSLVIADLPAAGLGNKLFVLGKAIVFAHRHALPLYIKGLNTASIGPFLRGENVKRIYIGQFKTNPTSAIRLRLWHRLRNTPVVKEPYLDAILEKAACRYVFHQMPHWSDLFGSIRNERSLVQTEILKLLSAKTTNKLQKDFDSCDIHVHVRMGDFDKLKEGTDFKLVGKTRTPLNYFINTIESLRRNNPELRTVRIFSDGHPEELTPLQQLDNVYINKPDSDVVDLLRMGKCKVLLTSAGSTFGEWAGFLSEAAIIQHPDHIHAAIRPADHRFFEGTAQEYLAMVTTTASA